MLWLWSLLDVIVSNNESESYDDFVMINVLIIIFKNYDYYIIGTIIFNSTEIPQ